MPNTTSAKKRLRQSEGRRSRNRAAKRSIRTQIRKVRELIAAGNAGEATTEVQTLAKKVDQAAAKGIVHPNLAGRIKSRISSRLKSLKTKTS
jgi:small subunit ribosomal protein S20